MGMNIKEIQHLIKIKLRYGLSFLYLLFLNCYVCYGYDKIIVNTIDYGIVIKQANTHLRILAYTPNSIRVTHNPSNIFSNKASFSVNAIPQHIKFKYIHHNGTVTFSTDSATVTADFNNNILLFYNAMGQLQLSAVINDKENFSAIDDLGEKAYQIKQKFIFDTSEGLYGLGQYENGTMNYRGQHINISQANRVSVNPFLVSSKGYGILWDNYSASVFDATAKESFFSSEIADEIDYYVCLGNTIDDAIAGYRTITGKAPMFAKWALGYWQSKERYKSAEELVNVLKQYRKLKIPIDNIVQDWRYWGDETYFSGMVWDKENFANPKNWIDSIHKYNGHLMVSIWPAFGVKSEIYKEMDQKGFLYSPKHWSKGKVYDAFSAEARQIYWKYVKESMFDNGVDAYWMDGTEPEFMCSEDRNTVSIATKAANKNALGSMARYLNAYSLQTTKGVYENHRGINSDKRAFILTRKAFAGQQRYAAATWSGDIFASFDVLEKQIAAGINFSMSGIPYWTTDIGGFFISLKYPKGIADPAYRELYTRWFQYGTFCPLFRSHGTNTPREVWQFGNEQSTEYQTLKNFIKLRYSLMPYIYSQASQVNLHNATLMRGLVMDFGADKKTHTIGNQFMFGKSIMVCPVTKEIYHHGTPIGETIPSNKLFDSVGNNTGLKLEIFNDTSFKTKVIERLVDISSLGWFGCCITDTVKDTYSAKLTGQVKTLGAGEYKFLMLTDAQVKMWIGDKLIIDNGNNKETKTFTGSIKLNSETKYPIRIEYKQFKPQNATLRFNWDTPEEQQKASLPVKAEISVYLPSNQIWFDFWTGIKTKGGKTISAKATLDIMPIYIKSGSIIPLAVDKQYAMEKKDDVIELRVYTGANAQFNLYEDEGDNYNYENGFSSTISISWDEKAQNLTIDKQKGEFKGMLKSRKFNIVWVSENHGIGIGLVNKPDAVLTYTGSKIVVKK